MTTRLHGPGKQVGEVLWAEVRADAEVEVVRRDGGGVADGGRRTGPGQATGRRAVSRKALSATQLTRWCGVGCRSWILTYRGADKPLQKCSALAPIVSRQHL